MFVVKRDFDPLDAMIHDWISSFKQVNTGANQRDRMRINASQRGEQLGLERAIAHILTEMRVEAYPALGIVPTLDDHDVRFKLLINLTEIFNHHKNLENESDIKNISREKLKSLRMENKEVFETKKSELIYDLIHSEELQKDEFERHKKAVLAGEESATESDLEWIQAELERQREFFNKISSTLESAAESDREWIQAELERQREIFSTVSFILERTGSANES